MSSAIIRQKDSEKYKREKEIIQLTAEQIIKDFALFGMEILKKSQPRMPAGRGLNTNTLKRIIQPFQGCTLFRIL